MSKRVSAVLSPQALIMIDDLLATGLHGATRADFVREAVYRVLRDACEPIRLRIRPMVGGRK